MLSLASKEIESNDLNNFFTKITNENTNDDKNKDTYIDKTTILG